MRSIRPFSHFCGNTEPDGLENRFARLVELLGETNALNVRGTMASASGGKADSAGANGDDAIGFQHTTGPGELYRMAILRRKDRYSTLRAQPPRRTSV
jgi:hypothetical protein